jgi:ornithine carbamoyltransferase
VQSTEDGGLRSIIPAVAAEHLLTLKDYDRTAVEAVFSLAAKVKAAPGDFENALRGRAVAFLFERPAPFARLSFELAVSQLGGLAVDLGAGAIRFDQPGSVAHASLLLARSVDAVVARLESHRDLVELARPERIPVVNVRSDLLNPVQALADYFTLRENRGRLDGLQIAYVGAGGDVCNALLMGAVTLGLSMAVAAPKGHEPNSLILKSACREADRAGLPRPVLTTDPRAAVAGADVVYTDTWPSGDGGVSGGSGAIEGFAVTAELMRSAGKGAVFMHALSSPWGEEVAPEVIEGPQSLVLDQAENRRHVQKAILLRVLKAA